MTAGSILTLGLGSFGARFIITLGLGGSAVTPTGMVHVVAGQMATRLKAASGDVYVPGGHVGEMYHPGVAAGGVK